MSLLRNLAHARHAIVRPSTQVLFRAHQPIQPRVIFAGAWVQLEQQRFAGHNKWSKVKHTKGAKDAKKSKLYSKISLEIVSAVRAGGVDPLVNSNLAAVLNRAKAACMPKESIENAIKKATDRNKGDLENVVYECYGPAGVAMIIEAVTAKKSRTVKEVKEVLNRLGGSVSSVGWMFDKKGKIVFGPGLSGHDFDQMSDAAIEAGAEDIEFEDDLVEIICEFSQLNAINQALIKENYEIQQMEATYIPQSGTEITDKETFELVDKCIDDMENLDDVVKLHHNAVVAFEDEQQQ